MNARHPLTQLSLAVFGTLVLGACHFHSRAWLAEHARVDRGDETTATAHADTQPVVVRQSGEPVAAAPAKKEAPKDVRKRLALAAASDGRTVGMFLMANDIDLSFARIVYTTSTNEDVRVFARRMLTDHTQMIANMRAVASDQDLEPADDMAARDLRDLSTMQRDSLRALTGREFDTRYIAMELERHRDMLTMIDDVLLPRARSAPLREVLASMRPIVAAHLAHAEQLRATLARH
jgi:putative membrane protein